MVEVQHANPYYDDSYAGNSASMGPWGDAIMHELLPAIESRFRGIGKAGLDSRTVAPLAAGRRLPFK